MCVERAIASICGLSSTERAYPSPRLSATFESRLHPQALGSMRPPSARGKQLGLSVILAQGLLRVTRRSVRMRRTPKNVHAGLLHVRHAHCAPGERSGHPDEDGRMHFLTVEPVCAIAPAITGSNGDMTLAEAFSAINNVIDVSESAPVLPAILPALRTTTPTLCCEPKKGENVSIPEGQSRSNTSCPYTSFPIAIPVPLEPVVVERSMQSRPLSPRRATPHGSSCERPHGSYKQRWSSAPGDGRRLRRRKVARHVSGDNAGTDAHLRASTPAVTFWAPRVRLQECNKGRIIGHEEGVAVAVPQGCQSYHSPGDREAACVLLETCGRPCA